MKKTLAFILSVTLVLMMALTACNGNRDTDVQASGGNDGNTTKQLEKIVITEPARGIHYLVIYLAEGLGYFEEAGLDVEFQTVSGGDPGAPVFAGEAQFGLRGVEMPMKANAAGQGCKIIASALGKYPYALVAKAEFDTVESLKGHIVAGTTPSGSPTAWVKACLTHAGLDYDNDVEMPMFNGPSGTAAFLAGESDAYCPTSPWDMKRALDAGGHILMDGMDSNTFKTVMGSETYEMHMIFTTDEYIKSNPETVQKVVTAIAKAIKWANESGRTVEELAKAVQPLFEDRDEEILYSIQNMKDTDLWTKDGYHTESGFEAANKISIMCGLLEKEISADAVYDESFLDKAWAEIGK